MQLIRQIEKIIAGNEHQKPENLISAEAVNSVSRINDESLKHFKQQCATISTSGSAPLDSTQMNSNAPNGENFLYPRLSQVKL